MGRQAGGREGNREAGRHGRTARGRKWTGWRRAGNGWYWSRSRKTVKLLTSTVFLNSSLSPQLSQHTGNTPTIVKSLYAATRLETRKDCREQTTGLTECAAAGTSVAKSNFQKELHSLLRNAKLCQKEKSTL